MAHKEVPRQTASNYTFRWLKNGRPVVDFHSDEMFVEEVYVTANDLDFVRFGLILKLGNIQVCFFSFFVALLFCLTQNYFINKESANFTCEVFDQRSKDNPEFKDGDYPKTVVPVDVHVANDMLAVCNVQKDSGMFWPRTLKV